MANHYFNSRIQSTNRSTSVNHKITSITVPITSKSTNYALPIQLLIPKINVNTNVEYIGLTSSGDVAVPTNSVAVGWYKYGALPGTVGTAIIVGHVDNSIGQAAVFTHLNKLQIGDNVTVVDSKGQNISFTVSGTQVYNKSENPVVVFKATDNRAHLNLITCTGPWDAAKYGFTERLVVFADKTN